MTATDTAVEPLIAGDQLTREEFLDRWEAMPELKFAELIGGTVFMPSPLRPEHARSDADITYVLRHYAVHTPRCDVGSNSTWLMLADSPQPDCYLRIDERCGGSSWMGERYLEGAPELVAEVCLSSSSYDLNQKKALYEAAGVAEYLALLVARRELRWFRLVGKEYQQVPVPPDGIIRSLVFPGLWLDVGALLDGDMLKVIEVLERGLATPQHGEFVERIRQKGESEA